MGLIDLLSPKLREPAECVIKVDGVELVEFYPFLTEVTVDSTRARWCEGTLHFESRRDERGNWAVQDKGVFANWKRITIDAAFGAHTKPVLDGFIQEVSADYPADQGGATVTVKCRDATYKLDREHVRKTWGDEKAPVTDRQIFSEIVGKHHLTTVQPPGTGQAGIKNANQDSTDIVFLKRRATINGYDLLFEEEGVYFGPPRLSAQAQPTILIYAGPDTNCLSFSVAADGHLPDKVAFERPADSGSGTEDVVVTPDLDSLGAEPADSSAAGLDDFVWRLSRQGSRSSADELKALAQAKANEFAMKVKAHGELDGSLYGDVLRVGHPVGVDGVGTWLGGVYFVDTVKHRFNTEGYRQSFTLLRNAYGDNL